MSKEAIEAARDELQITADKIVEEIREVLDEYWIQWRLENKKLGNIEKSAGYADGYLRGNIAPRLTVRSGKTYAEWIVYGPGRYGGRQKNWGDRIAPRKGPYYHKSQFEKKAKPWELELIIAAEGKIRHLRYALESIHGSKAYLSRLVHKINQNVNEEESTND